MTTINTSRNTTPKVLKSKPFVNHMSVLISSMKHLNMLNYGAGKYWENLSEHVIYHYHILRPIIVSYDPHIKDIGTNYKTKHRTYLTDNLNNSILARYNTVVCSNVLNVIDNDVEALKVISECLEALTVGGKAFFSIYEGKRTGEGKTTRDGYQRNQKASSYNWLFIHAIKSLDDRYFKFEYQRKGTNHIITRLK